MSVSLTEPEGLNCLHPMLSKSLLLTPKEFIYDYEAHVLMELCPLSELRRLSTEPPALSLGLSTCSLSGWEDGTEPGIPSRHESCNGFQQHYVSSAWTSVILEFEAI